VEEKPEWQMSAAERRAKLAREYQERRKQRRLGRLRKDVKQRPKPSDVTITHADGSVEVRKPYTVTKANQIIAEGNSRLAEVYREYKGGGEPPLEDGELRL
jgi:hypothetical protein